MTPRAEDGDLRRPVPARVGGTEARVAEERGPERFLVRGRVEGLPRRRADRELLLRWVAHRVLPLEEPVEERWLTEQLAGLARDPVGLRRELVDAGLVTRTRDGSAYWRTHVTEFDVLGQDGMPMA